MLRFLYCGFVTDINSDFYLIVFFTDMRFLLMLFAWDIIGFRILLRDSIRELTCIDLSYAVCHSIFYRFVLEIHIYTFLTRCQLILHC